uniref:Odorant-binding protein 17 n=1 Tax=Eocanthecona furcellata TaxID=696902 RepID=A0AAT9TZB9_9HEMI
MIILRQSKYYVLPASKKCIFIIYVLLSHLYHLGSLIHAHSYDYSRKASSFKINFMESSKHCSNLYNTSLVDILPLFARVDIGSIQAKCFLLCLLQRYQMIDKGGTFHRDRVDRFLDSMPDSKFKSSLKLFKDKCLKEDSQNQCQKAYKFSACFYKSNIDKEHGS